MLTFSYTMLLSTQFSSNAFAQNFDKEEPKKKKYQVIDDQRAVREVERGWFAKSNIGGAFYFTSVGSYIKPGTFMSMVGGKDVVDRENMSISWEVGLSSGVHNGVTPAGQYSPNQVELGCSTTQTCMQGDSRTFMLSGVGEYSYYSNPRIGIGVRAGFGLMGVPLLMDQEYYEKDIAGAFGYIPTVHQGIKPVGIGGLTFEYYTKLSHFSIGVDADFMFVVGIGPGASTSGYFKYTF